MTGWWGDVTARAAGLSSGLLEGPALEGLARAPDLDALGAVLRGRGWTLPPAGEAITPEGLDASIRRRGARRLALLRRWLGDRARRVALLYEEEVWRSVRALIRGAAGGAPAGARLAGLVPTPELPAARLEELARLPTPEEVIERLAREGSPYGLAAARALARGGAALFEVEAALDRERASRAVRGARRAGRVLREYAAEAVDLMNAWTALLAPALAPETDPGALFLEGGRRLGRRRFAAVAAARSAEERRLTLAAAFTPGALGRALAAAGPETSRWEGRLLEARIAEARRRARTDPGSPAPLLAFALRVRAEAVNLRRIAWGIRLGAPADALADELVRVR